MFGTWGFCVLRAEVITFVYGFPVLVEDFCGMIEIYDGCDD